MSGISGSIGDSSGRLTKKLSVDSARSACSVSRFGVRGRYMTDSARVLFFCCIV